MNKFWIFLVALATAPLAAEVPPSASAPRPHEMRLTSNAELIFPAGVEVVELPFRREANRILLSAKLQGAGPFELVLDTGAPIAFVQDKTRIAGAELDFLPHSIQIQGAGGATSIAARLTREASFDFGGIELRHASLAVADSAAGSAGSHLGAATFAGIVGREIFANAVVEIDWAASRLRLHRPASFTAPSGATSLPLSFEGGHIFVEALVEMPGLPPVPAKLVVDSGAHHALSLVPPRFAPPAAKLPGILLGRGLSGAIRGAAARIPSLRLGGQTLRDLVVTFPDEGASNVAVAGDGNLGVEVLRRFTTIFDYPGKRLLLLPGQAAAEPFRFSTSGVRVSSFKTAEGYLEVEETYPGSPAANAGLRQGDLLTHLGGRSLRELSVDQALELLQGDPGQKLEIGFHRAGRDQQVDLVLEKLV